MTSPKQQNVAIQNLAEKNLNGFKSALEHLPLEERRKLVNEKVDDKCAFYLACEQGELDFVKYMLNFCDPDVTQYGNFVDDDQGGMVYQVPPMWIAAVGNHNEVVKTLVQHGASVNIISDLKSTPLRAACYGGNYDLVKYLINQGADVNAQSNSNSVPIHCASMHSIALCELLIQNGACLNGINLFGGNELSLVAENNRLDLVKLFIENGGDCNIRLKYSDDEDDVIRFAALKSSKPVLDYMIQHSNLKKLEIIEAYELMGCTLVDTYNDLDKALKVWEKAMAFRESNSKIPIKRSLCSGNNVYEGYSEPQSLDEYKHKWNRDEIYLHTLVTRERILGKPHRSTVKGINFRAAVYYDNKNYKRCLELWKYSFALECDSYPATDVDPVTTAQMIISLFFVMESELRAQQTTDKVSAKDFMDIFGKVIQQVKKGNEELRIRPLEKHTHGNFGCLLVVALHFINFRFTLELCEAEHALFISFVSQLVQVHPMAELGQSLLHYALIPDNSVVNQQFCSRFPSPRLVEVLIENGASVNIADDVMDTPLHLAIPLLTTHGAKDDCEKIVRYLLEQNPHLDVRNRKGHCVLTWLYNRDYPVHLVRDRSLACLVADAIVNYGIPYRSKLPVDLADFVKIHGGDAA